MEYKTWLLSEELKNLSFYKNILMSKFGINNTNGNTSIKMLDAGKLIQSLNELGEYVKLPALKKRSIEAQIRSKIGTLDDIAKKMSQ